MSAPSDVAKLNEHIRENVPLRWSAGRAGKPRHSGHNSRAGLAKSLARDTAQVEFASLPVQQPPAAAASLHPVVLSAGSAIRTPAEILSLAASRSALIARQNLPKGLKTVDAVLQAWEHGRDGLLPMSSFVGNKHPRIKPDRAERRQLNDHARIARNVLGGVGAEGVGREQFRVRYEVDAAGQTRTLKAIRVMLDNEAKAAKIS